MKRSLFSSLVLIVAGGLFAEPCAQTASTAVKGAAVKPVAVDLMTLHQDARCKQVLATALVNDVPFLVLLDTGATHTVLHTERAKRLSGEGVKWLDTSKIQFNGNAQQRPELLLTSIKVGPGEFDPRPLLVMDLSGIRSMMDEKVEGIIGMDLLRYLPFTFDFHAKQFQWGYAALPELAALKGECDPNLRLKMAVASGEKTFSLLLDTGSTVTRIRECDWAPGRGEVIAAQISDINAAGKRDLREGKAGVLTLASGVETRAFQPLLCGEEELTMLGLDALEGLILFHLPGANAPGGDFFIGKP